MLQYFIFIFPSTRFPCNNQQILVNPWAFSQLLCMHLYANTYIILVPFVSINTRILYIVFCALLFH